jgi:preprotein translocase subunit YajC
LATLFAILAQTTQSTTRAAKPEWFDFFRSPLTVVMVCFLIFYVFLIRNKKSQENQRKGMLNQLKRGDRIKTIGGILGTVIEAKDDEVLVKVDESSNTKIRFARSAIHQIIEPPKT